MNNDVIIQGRDFNNYLNYFGLKANFTIEELERQRYIKSKEDGANLKLDEMYKALLEVKLTDLKRKSELSKGEIHREEFVKGFKEKYNTKLPKYSSKDELNNKLNRVLAYVNAVNKDNNITEVYDGYVSNVKDFMNLYSSELDQRNKSVMTDLINEKKDNVVNSTSTILNNSLDVVINNFNNDIKNQVNYVNESMYLIKLINLAFKDVQKIYQGPKVDSLLGKYRNEIDTFLETKYNYYIKLNDGINPSSEEEKQAAKDKFLKDFSNSIVSFFTKIFKKVYLEVKEDLEQAKENLIIDNSLYTVLNIQLKKATNLNDLASIYNRVHGEIKSIKFAK